MESNEKTARVRIIRMREVVSRTGLAKSTIYNLMNAGKFPVKLKLSDKAIGFVESEVEQWIAEQLAKRGRE